MKRIRGILLGVAAASQLFACAHSTPTQSALSGDQLSSQIQAGAMYRRLNFFRRQKRDEVLKALSLQHQHLVSQLFGRLVVEQKPDVVAAVRKLDSALTPKEKQSILRASISLRQQYIALTESLRQKMARRGENLSIGAAKISREDPGMVVLLLLTENLSYQTSKAAHGLNSMF